MILGLGKKKKPGLGGKWPLKVEGSVYAWATRRKKKEEEEGRSWKNTSEGCRLIGVQAE